MRCHFGEETTIARTRGGGFDAVRRLPHALVWSASEGLFVRRGDGQSERLGSRCTGGLDAIEDGDELLVACALRARPDAAKAGGLTLWRLAGASRTRTLLPGPVGEEGQGVALATHSGSLELAWHAGEPRAFHVWRQTIGPDLAPLGEPWRLSDPRVAAGAPTLFVHDGQLAIVWAEHWAQSGARHTIGGHVRIAVGDRPPRVLVEVEDPAPHPVLGRDARGPLLLFRDQRAPLEHPSLFAHRLTSDFRLHGRLRLIGRADEGGPIRTFACELGGQPTQAALVARSWGREDALVALHFLGDDLGERYGELQVYAFGGQLVWSDGSCADERLELLVAERSVPSGPPAQLFTLPATCGR